jgi:L-histidine N-alpha-methyltransferase
VFNPSASRIEMHLVSRNAQDVRVGSDTFAFAEGETENSPCGSVQTLSQVQPARSARAWKVATVYL